MEKSRNYKKYKFLYQKEYYEFYDRKLLYEKNYEPNTKLIPG